MGLNKRIVDGLFNRFYPNHRYSEPQIGRALGFDFRPGMRLLDAGCGGGWHYNYREQLKGACAVGIDLSDSLRENPMIDAGLIGSLERLPFNNESFDAIISLFVVEHLEDPVHVFREFRRVLRPGGHLALATPNNRHYVSLVSRFTPQWFHVLYNRINGRHEDNICSVWYRANNRKVIARIAAESGFTIETNEVVECEPIYFRPFFPLYILGILYERIVNITPLLEDQRCTIIARLKRA